MLTVRLDPETEQHLAELVEREQCTRSDVIKRLIQDRWLQVQPSYSILSRRGGVPKHMMAGADDLSSRERRKLAVAARMHTRHRA